jgi:putative colanic acid biosynthesis acetyltransferase WcaF
MRDTQHQTKYDQSKCDSAHLGRQVVTQDGWVPLPATLETISIKGLPEGTIVGNFTTKDKALRVLWYIVQATLFRCSPRRADRWRAFLIRCFGGKIGKVDVIRNTVRIEVPWYITLGDHVQLGDRVYLYSIGPISIGDHTIISQFSHVCGGTHDAERLDFPLVRIPITIGSYCWIATEVFISPGVTIGNGVVVGARANVLTDLPEWKICVGSPAKPIKDRRLVNTETGEVLSPTDGQAYE